MSAVPEVAAPAAKPAGGFGPAITILTVLFLAGAGNLGYLLATQPEAVPWSFLTASFVFVLGVSQFGIAFVAIMRICRAKWARPYYRVGEVATLSFLPLAFVVFLIIFAYGREHLFFWLHPEPGEHLRPWLNEAFLLIRNLVAQGVFYALAVVYFLIGLIPDAGDDGSGWLSSQKKQRDLSKLKTNTYMLAGPHDPAEIIASVERGIYAPNFGGGQVDITSGKFVFSASEAYLIEKGKTTRPVKGAMLIGDGPDILGRISMVGNDLSLDQGVGTCGKEGQSVPVGVGQPTLKIDEITVGGTA